MSEQQITGAAGETPAEAGSAAEHPAAGAAPVSVGQGSASGHASGSISGPGRLFRLRELGVLARIGVAGLVLTMVGGTAASGLFLYLNQENRDERPGLTVDDVKAHYHGIRTVAPLLVALEAGHPNELSPEIPLADADRQVLIDWLTGDPARLAVDFDNLDLGEEAPAEIMAISCLECHTRNAMVENAAPDIPLEFWDDVQPLAVTRDIQPVDLRILAASTHTHALALASLGIAMALLTLLTSWPRVLVGLVLAVSGVGLVADIGAWWVTREVVEFAHVVVVGGAMFNGGVVVMSVMVLIDLLLPKPKR